MKESEILKSIEEHEQNNKMIVENLDILPFNTEVKATTLICIIEEMMQENSCFTVLPDIEEIIEDPLVISRHAQKFTILLNNARTLISSKKENFAEFDYAFYATFQKYLLKKNTYTLKQMINNGFEKNKVLSNYINYLEFIYFEGLDDCDDALELFKLNYQI